MPAADSPPPADLPQNEDGTAAVGEDITSPAGQSLDAQPVRRVPRQQTGQVTLTSAFYGPLPPPDMLKAYNEVEPGLGREIIEWAKAEAQHRRETDERESKAATEIAIKEADARTEEMRRGFTEARLGQWFGFLLGGGAIGGAVFLAQHDAQTTACILVGTGIASIIGAFLKKPAPTEPSKTLDVKGQDDTEKSDNP